MPKYTAEVCRIGYGFRNIEINAPSMDEASSIILEIAGNFEYSEKDANYEINSIWPEDEAEASIDRNEAIESFARDALKMIRDLCYGFNLHADTDSIEKRAAQLGIDKP